MAEFSAFGIAGARVDRIAKNAGCNKNLIYIYFENKETLFSTFLQKHLSRVYEDIAFTPENLPGYAMRAFDYTMANPDLMRLMSWFSLEQKIENPAERRDLQDKKLAALLEAQNSGEIGSAFSPGFILATTMTLATAWTAANPFGNTIYPEAVQNMDALRTAIGTAVKVITQAEPGNHT